LSFSPAIPMGKMMRSWFLAFLFVGWPVITTTVTKPPESQVCSAQWFYEVGVEMVG
jgi:hypothetical protein